MAPEPLGLGVLDQRLRLDRAVVRPVGVHVEIDDDPVTVAERVTAGMRGGHRRPSPSGDPPVDVLEPLREPIEIRGLGLCAGLRSRARAKSFVLGQSRHRGGCELGLVGEARRLRDRAAAGSRLEHQPGAAARGRHEDRGLGQGRSTCIRLHERPRSRPVADRCRDRRSPRQGRRAREHDLPVGQRPQEPQHSSGDGALAGCELHDDQLPLRRRGEGRGVDAEGNRLVVAREPLGCALDRAGRRAEERIDAGEQFRALVLARRNGDPLGGEERGGRRRLGLEQRCRGEARETGLEPVHDIERADREGGREVGAHAHRQGHALRQGGGDGGADRDDIADRASLEGAATFEQVRGTRRRGDDGDEVAAPAQRLCRTAHVLVDVVRL